MRYGRFGLTLVFLFALALVGPGATRTSGSAVAALLWLNPAASEVPPGGSTSLALQLDDIMNVYGIDVRIGFDPAILSVVEITPGVCPQPDFVVVNEVTGGTISYAVTQLNPTPPCNGGIVATLEFECVPGLAAEVGSAVTIDSSLVANPDGIPLDHTVQNAVVTCLVHPSLTVNRIGAGFGRVMSDPSGIDCGDDCSEAYAPDTEVTLSATRDPGSTFDGWGGHCSGTLPSTSVIMDSSKTCTATFEPCSPIKDISGLEIGDEQYYEACSALEAGNLRVIGPGGFATLIAGERIAIGNGSEVLGGGTLILGLDPTLQP
jgi:uncharacterized repeat protein (TIGR02543 family)